MKDEAMPETNEPTTSHAALASEVARLRNELTKATCALYLIGRQAQSCIEIADGARDRALPPEVQLANINTRLILATIQFECRATANSITQ